MFGELFRISDQRIVTRVLLIWASFLQIYQWYVIYAHVLSALPSPDLSFIKMSKCWFPLIPEFGQSPANYYFKYLQKPVWDITFYECIIFILFPDVLDTEQVLLSSTWLKCNVRKIWVMLRILCLLLQLIRCLIWKYPHIEAGCLLWPYSATMIVLVTINYDCHGHRSILIWPFLIVFCFRADLNSFLQMSLIVIVFRLHFQWQCLKWRIWNFRKLSSKDCLWLSYPIKCWSSRSGAASLPSTTDTFII